MGKLFSWLGLIRRARRRFRNGFTGRIVTSQDRRRARRFALWADEGVLRLFWTNFDQVAPGVFRANHGSPARIRRYARMELRTIVNLRGEQNLPTSLLSQEAAEELGIRVITLPMSARKPPRRDTILGLLDLFDRIERPFLLHCKSGADRSGLAAAIWLLHIEKRPMSEARAQLSLRYLHFRCTTTGVLDGFLDLYEAQGAGMMFRDWVENIYDPSQCRR